MTPPLSPDQPISPATLNQSISLLSKLLSLSTSALCRSCGTYGHLATADVVKLWNLKRKIYRHTERRKWNSRFNHWMWNVSEVVTEINSRKRNPLSTCAHATRNIKISKFYFCSNFAFQIWRRLTLWHRLDTRISLWGDQQFSWLSVVVEARPPARGTTSLSIGLAEDIHNRRGREAAEIDPRTE